MVVDYDNMCYRIIENAGAIRFASTGRVHYVEAPPGMPYPFTIFTITTSRSATLWSWRFVMASRHDTPAVFVMELTKVRQLLGNHCLWN